MENKKTFHGGSIHGYFLELHIPHFIIFDFFYLTATLIIMVGGTINTTRVTSSIFYGDNLIRIMLSPVQISNKHFPTTIVILVVEVYNGETLCTR